MFNFFYVTSLFFVWNSCIFLSLVAAEDNFQDTSRSKIVLLSEKDHEWINLFVKDFFMKDEMIYTLFGSKPMTSIQITNMPKEECLAQWKIVLDSNEVSDEQKQLILRKIEKDCRNATVKNFNHWIALKKSHPFSSFLFRAKYTDADQRYLLVDVINLRETVWILQKHYELFFRETEIKFDAMEVAQDFENMESVFWEKVFCNSYLLGILYGFGERNAYFFSKMKEADSTLVQITQSHPLFLSEIINCQKRDVIKELTLENLDIPYFRSFDVPLMEDPIITRFKEERALIQKKLQGKDLAEEILKKLTLISITPVVGDINLSRRMINLCSK